MIKKKQCINLIVLLMMTLVLFTACKSNYKAGVYEGVGNGRNGDIRISVTIDAKGKIENLEIVESEENKEFIEASFEKMKEEIIKENGTKVDTVSGATATSNGIIEAVEKAIEEATK